MRVAPTLFFDSLTFGFACIWCAYFWKAKRVRMVFIDRAWRSIKEKMKTWTQSDMSVSELAYTGSEK